MDRQSATWTSPATTTAKLTDQKHSVLIEQLETTGKGGETRQCVNEAADQLIKCQLLIRLNSSSQGGHDWLTTPMSGWLTGLVEWDQEEKQVNPAGGEISPSRLANVHLLARKETKRNASQSSLLGVPKKLFSTSIIDFSSSCPRHQSDRWRLSPKFNWPLSPSHEPSR